MTPEQKKAAEYAEILLAFSRGEKIEHKPKYGDCKWTENPAPAWNFAGFEHRIAPQPVEVWVRWGGLGEHCVYETKEVAENAALQYGGRAVLMREVTE